MAKIFISYKRNFEPDTLVATAVFESLRHDHVVFMDTTLTVGEKWAERIQTEIKESDYLIIFLSENSVHSEMVIAEIETVYHYGKAHGGKPAILPVRLAYTEPLVYPISAYLNPLHWALWEKESDTPRLIAELQHAVSGENLLSKAANTKVMIPADEEIPTGMPPTRPLKVFLCHASSDKPAVRKLYHRLSLEGWIDPWLDEEKLSFGQHWTTAIEEALDTADIVLIFLSHNSVQREGFIQRELNYAWELSLEKPIEAIFLIPLRLDDCEVPRRLRSRQWGDYFGDREESTYQVLLRSLRQRHQQKMKLEMEEQRQHDAVEKIVRENFFVNTITDLGSPEGTMPHQSPFYIERDGDRKAMQVLEDKGFTVIIKGSRQIGKSSLLNRLITEATKRHMRVAFIDFQMIEKKVIENADTFYCQFCSLLSSEFDVEDRTEEFWKNPFDQVRKTTNYVTKYLLKELQAAQLLLAMEEVERMFFSPFRSDFFGMIRSWHNSRARGGDWTRFNIAMVTSTEPYQLITDLNQSPFNVGTVVELKDFTPVQVNDLNQRHGNPLSITQAAKISELLGGHPFLTRKALYLVASKRATFDEIVKNACEDDGPFGDHLRNHLFRVIDHQELKSGLMQVIKYHRCADEHVFFRLRGAGLVRRVGNEVFPRTQLYAEYFGRRLSG